VESTEASSRVLSSLDSSIESGDTPMKRITRERLGVWEFQEASVLRAGARATAMPRPTRGVALRLLAIMRNASVGAESCPNLWFRSVQFLDTGAAGLAGAPPGKAMSRAMAAFGLSLKFEQDICKNTTMDVVLRGLAERVPSSVMSCGSSEEMLVDVAREECALLAALAGGQAAPTVVCWLNALLPLLDDALGCQDMCSSAFSLKVVLAWAERLAWQIPVSISQPPRTTAVGICGVLAVALGMLPPDVLCPPHVSVESWRNTFQAVASVSGVKTGESGWHDPYAAMSLFAETSGCDACLLRASTLTVLDALRTHLVPQATALTITLSA